MGQHTFNVNQNFYFARARPRAMRAYENSKKDIVFAIVFAALTNFAQASNKEMLFEKLNNASEPTERVRVLAQLSAAGLTSKEISKVEPYLQEHDVRVRSQAIAVLGAHGDKSVVTPIIRVLQNDTDAGTRIAAAFWLGSLKSIAAINALDRALTEDTDANVRAQAAQALKRIGTTNAKASLRKGRSDKDARVKKLSND